MEEVDATTRSVDEGDASGLGVEDEEVDAKTPPVEWLAEVVAETDVEGGGVEEEGGGVPVMTTVFASTTVLVMYVVDVKTVVRGPASEGSARVSGEKKTTTRAPRRGFGRRIAKAFWFREG